MAHSACGPLTTWKLPGRLCGMWVDTAACGRGAPRGGLECKPARRPERKQEGREEQSTHIEDRSGKQPRCSRAPGDLLHWFWMETPRGWLSRVPGKAAHDYTPDKHRNPAHNNRTCGSHRGTGAPSLPPVWGGRRHLLWPRPWWNVPGAGPVTMASLETPALAEESALKEITWRGSWEIIPKGFEFKAPGSFGLPAL